MDRIKVYYSSVNNMGDMLNKDLIEKCFNCEVVKKGIYNVQVSAIGSGLGSFLYSSSIKDNIKKFIYGLIFPKTYVWGTGFISYTIPEKKFYKRKIKFCAVRGLLTKKKVEKIIGKELNIPVGDGGILASYLLDEVPQKKYDVGIIPHFREKDCRLFEILKGNFENSVMIDVQDSPINVIKKIAECKYIISSSLHGLIIADSLRIPNIHVVATNNLLGDGFKFDDYYSAYGLKHKFVDLNKESIPDLNFITENYEITDEMVQNMKKNMIECFPFKK